MAGQPVAPVTPSRWFTESRRLLAVKPVLLADIGEGWFRLIAIFALVSLTAR